MGGDRCGCADLVGAGWVTAEVLGAAHTGSKASAKLSAAAAGFSLPPRHAENSRRSTLTSMTPGTWGCLVLPRVSLES